MEGWIEIYTNSASNNNSSNKAGDSHSNNNSHIHRNKMD